MAAYLITGFPGMGKTSIARELKRRGYAAYDPEVMRGYMHLQSVETGRAVKRPQNAPRGWFDTVGAYNWDPVRLASLLDSHEDVFICSLADNMNDFLERFAKIFVLTLDDTVLEQRLRSRTKGATHEPSQLADILILHRQFEAGLITKGAVDIDVRSSVPAVVDKILALCHAQ